MSLAAYLHGLLHTARSRRAMRQALARVDAAGLDAALNDWSRSLSQPTAFYLDCFRAFHLVLPDSLRAHRKYFRAARRGFGEDAFHTMWWMLFRRFQVRNFCEIGVYRGQSLSLAGLLQGELGLDGILTGISPFESIGDSVSKYRTGLDYQADTLANFVHFQLPAPTLVRAFSNDPLAVDVLRRTTWDCIYIDGNHDYEVARADWKNSAASIKPAGIIVLDDSALGTHYEPPPFAGGGHPGPSQVAREVDPSQFREILAVGHNRVFQKLA